MRRTHAPSQSYKTALVNKGFSSIAGAARTTDKLLNLLTTCETENDTSNVETLPVVSDVDCMDSKLVTETISDKKIYNVVWGKQTKKKHKTWEGDGIVELSNDIAVLKDQNGQILGRSSKLKNVVLEEGTRIYIGSKEVEIIDIVNQENTVSLIEKKSSEPFQTVRRPIKRLKTNAGFPLSRENDVDALIMPKPDLSHQWKYNTNMLSINDVKLDSFLSKVLRPHQKQGVLFLYSCITGIRNVKYNGAILADEMGLGKTLQCICLLWLLLKNGPYGGIPMVQRVLVVTPSSLANNWLKELKRWLGFERLQPYVINQKQKPSAYANVPASKSPVMIISYEMLIRHYDDIKDIKFQLLICDEGHRLKNKQIRTSMLLNQLQIKRRIILSGTPVQNDLQEFYTLIDFVNPGILGEYSEFKKYFEEPIVMSNQPNCSEETRLLGEERAKELNHSTNCFILRRTQSIINQYLPSKQECVVLCIPTSLQVELYKATVAFWEESLDELSKKVPHLSVITTLKKICNDPRLIRTTEEFDAIMYDLEDLEFDNQFESLSDHLQPILEKYTEITEYSGKMAALEAFLMELKPSREKVVLISYYTQTLDLLESLCKQRNYTFLRLDGSTPTATRIEIVDKFNNAHLDYFIFLLSAKAGGVGLNLIGASRLILFDLDWNPASDLQAMSRIWRDGQKRNVYIYRFLTVGTIEEKIYQRQISKTALSNAVIDTQSGINMRLSVEELKDLFTYKSDYKCLTHDLLECQCEGNGIPEVESQHHLSEDRDSQLTLKDGETKSSSKISELMEWEHYFSPLRDDVLKELYLKSAEKFISFIFRNKCSTVPVE